MNPIPFPEANANFGPPPDLADSQCLTIQGFVGHVQGGSVDGAQLAVTAWRPTPQELEILKAGGAVFLSVIGGLPPHYLSTSFQDAITLA